MDVINGWPLSQIRSQYRSTLSDSPVLELVLVPPRQVEGGGAEEHDHGLHDARVEDVEEASPSPSDCAHLQVPANIIMLVEEIGICFRFWVREQRER